LREPAPSPYTFCLEAVFPNPFNNQANIAFSIPYATSAAIRIFDATGRLWAVPVEGRLAAGQHFAVWNADSAPAGVYLVRLSTASGFTANRKAVLIK
jgi:hypothetical protein